MLVNKMKDVQLVPESKLLKIDPVNKIFSRFDKTVYIKEPIASSIKVAGSSAQYVEAARFFALLEDMTSIDLTENYCHILLKNGAEYKLPYVIADWQDREVNLEGAYSVKIKLVDGRLSSATLKNLANPILQCIYVDEATAVSCNSMVACVDGTVSSVKPLLLPPDIISLIEGQEVTIYVPDDNTYVITSEDAIVCVPIPQMDYSDAAATLRGALPENPTKYPVSKLFDSLKRLSASHETFVFEKDKVVADEDFEPFNFPCAIPTFVYSIQNLLSVVQQTKYIVQTEYALLLYGDKFLFMVSPEPTEETAEEEA